MITQAKFIPLYYALLIFLILNNKIEAKRGSSSSKSSSSHSSSSSHRSSSSHSSHSSSPSHTSHSYHSSPSYGWNTGSSNSHSSGYSSGWNTHTQSSPSYGWNTGSPSHNWNTHSSGSPSYSVNSYSPSRGSYYGSSYSSNRAYTKQFGSSGLGSNTYISNNYYGSNQGSNKGSTGGFLTNALFGGRRSYRRRNHYYNRNRNNNRNRGTTSTTTPRYDWNENKDRSWRATTANPYFLNKIPGGNRILPASAVIGAATAFGLMTLLPLNVPANKPLMYCNDIDEVTQAEIRIENGYIYQCVNDTIEITCPQIFFGFIDNSTSNLNATEKKSNCENRLMTCSEDGEEIIDGIYCKKDSLFSNGNLFCNSTTNFNDTETNETITVLNCYKGKLPDREASFIPTTPLPIGMTEKPSLSFGALMHIFMLKLIGQSEVLDKKFTSSTPDPEIPSWIPEALTIPPPETTTEGPYKWMMRIPIFHDNGTIGEKIEEVPESVLKAHKKNNEKFIQMGLRETEEMPSHYFKMYIDEEIPTESITTTTEPPYKWMMQIPTEFENGTFGIELQEVSEALLNIQKTVNDMSIRLGKKPTMPPGFVKVYVTTTEANVENSTEINTTTSTEKISEMNINKIKGSEEDYDDD
ncbi:hypothetical protein PVAND_004760 [Polypedilum vanderplanki]|uniref:Uncharacterized protein n=1 Tax=Polypedilum vanderplanki TaxID=319348 RepID=A0A9J6BZ27_POLVA|nr:hypothetical protein PVAND_004760 [Polypedilum vanderplanki]